MNFNEQSEKPTFIYKRNPLIEHSFQIFGLREGREDYDLIGEYTLIDMDEALDITEKKVMNLVSLLNGKRNLIDFSNLTKQRVLYNIVSDGTDEINKKVIFRTYDGDSVSKENAVMTIEKGVFRDDDSDESNIQ